MSEIHIAQLIRPKQSGAEPSWALRQAWDIMCQQERDVTGHSDDVGPLEQFLEDFRCSPGFVNAILIATLEPTGGEVGDWGFPTVSADAGRCRLPEVRVVGAARFMLPLDGEQAQIDDVEFSVSEPQRADVDRALLGAVEQVGQVTGRLLLKAWSVHSGAADANDPGAIRALNGEAAPHNDQAQTLIDVGYELLSVLRESRWDLPLDTGVLEVLEAQALPHAQGYVIEVDAGRTAEGDLADLAVLHARARLDAPHEGEEIDVQGWTPERVREKEEQFFHGNRRRVRALARHVSSGKLVAFTQMSLPLAEGDTTVNQGWTVVLPEHRGHRLGLLVKTAAFRRIAEAYPERTRMSTWNSFTNPQMLAINVALGGRIGATCGRWSKLIPTV